MPKTEQKSDWIFTDYKQLLPLFCVIVLASVMLLTNLSGYSLWQDEAQTALISKTILTEGVPKGTDGVNFFSQEQGAEYGENFLYVWHNWFPFYYLAGTYKLFGNNTLTSRLPFAILGILSIAAFYLLTYSIWKSKRLAVTASILLITCVPYLLLLRQCRYYAPLALFTLLAFFAYYCLTQKKRWSSPAFILFSFAIYHTHYLYFVTFITAAAIHALIFHRDKIKQIFFPIAIAAAICLPFFILQSKMKYSSAYELNYFDLTRIAKFSWVYLSQIAKYIANPLLFILPIGFWVLNKYRKQTAGNTPLRNDNIIIFITLYIFVNLIALGSVSPAPFFRYLTPLIPLIVILVAIIAEYGFRIHWGAGLVVIVICLALQPLPDYVYELTHKYEGPIDGIVSYLNQNAQTGDTVLITYEDLPIKFYTNLKVYGGLTGEDLNPATNADFVIIRANIISPGDYLVWQFIKENIPANNYEPIAIPYPDTPYQNRESPQDHLYRTDTKAPPVIIYKKLK